MQLTICEIERDKWLDPDKKILSPQDAYQAVKDLLENAPQEICCAMNLASDGSLVDISICSMGTVDQAFVSTKDVLRTCVLSDAPRFIFVHNHPSGNVTPSKDDVITTQRLANAAKMLDIQMSDSIIIGRNEYYSFRESSPGALECSSDVVDKSMVATISVNETPAEYIGDSIQDKKTYVSDFRRDMVNQFIGLINSGKAAYFSMWRGGAMHPVNFKTGNAYKGCNRFLLMASAIQHEYKDPRWLTFKQAQEAGFKIRKGEKATKLEKWDFTKKIKVLDENGKPVKDENGKTVYDEIPLDRPLCKIFYVFNGEQMEGISKYETVEPSKTEIEERIEALQESSDCPIINVAQDRSFYSPSADKIVLPLKSAFEDPSAYAEVLAHEMAHSTGHATRLDRGLENTTEETAYNFEELVAELGSAFTLNDLQIPPFKGDYSNSAGYLKHYIGLLKENPNVLFKAASYADKAAEYIKSNFEKEYTPSLREEKRLSEPRMLRDAQAKKKETEGLTQETARKVSYSI